MEWGMVFTALGTVAAVSGVLYGFLRDFKIDINAHLDRLEKKLDKMEARQDKIDARLDGHASRIDQLYQLCCDMLKERK